MAIRKPTPKPAPKQKPALKPAPKPRPTPKPLPRPRPAPLDLVRNPNFDSAMAQQNYQNSLAEQRARIDAERGRLGNQDFIDSRDPNRAYTADMVDYIDPATGERTSRTRGVVPAPGSRFVPANGNKFNPNLMPEEEEQRLDKLVADFAMQGAGQRESDIARRNAAMMQYDQAMRAGGAGYAQVDPNTNMPRLMPIKIPGSDALNQDLANRGMGGGIPSPIPQGQQMQDYQNFLKQGMQRSDTLNQGAMAGFANMQPGMQVPQAGVQVPQPGMQVPQAGIGQTQRPNMAGMATQQRRQNPAQRKFSTFSNKPARFF